MERKRCKGEGIHWMSWDRLCTPKKFGGMGFKHVHSFNLALLEKQGWRILSNPSCLMARIMRAKYFETVDSFMSAKLKSNASYGESRATQEPCEEENWRWKNNKNLEYALAPSRHKPHGRIPKTKRKSFKKSRLPH